MKSKQNRVYKKKRYKLRLAKLVLFITLSFVFLFVSAFFLYKNVQASKVNLSAGKTNIQISKKEKNRSNVQIKPVTSNDNNGDKTSAEPSQAPDQNQAQQQQQQTQPAEQPPVQQTTVAAVPADGSKVAYLTFDDGPSQNNTPKILDILKNENIKATFFVIGSMAERSPSLLKKEAAEGHTIGNHTYSHSLAYNRSTPQDFIEDFKKGDSVITSIIGNHDRSLIRFPGGSFNRTAYQHAATAAGYRYIDWNCLNGDAEVSLAPVDRLLRRFHETYSGQKQLIILMHDAPAKVTTPEALPEIIKFLKSQGYVFKTL